MRKTKKQVKVNKEPHIVLSRRGVHWVPTTRDRTFELPAVQADMCRIHAIKDEKVESRSLYTLHRKNFMQQKVRLHICCCYNIAQLCDNGILGNNTPGRSPHIEGASCKMSDLKTI